MSKKKDTLIYKQWWFYGIIVVVLAAAYFINNNSLAQGKNFDQNHEIHLFTREIGSGTRAAFVEVADIVDENGDDLLTPLATVQNSTNATMQAVASDSHAISYISLGSLNNTVKALAVNGIEPTVENIQNNHYSLVRNFSVTYGKELSEVAQDFWNFMFSQEAQALVAEDGYVAVATDAPSYTPSGLSGSISIVGSTSVEPTIQKFSELYTSLNPDVRIDITAPGSGAGITAAIDGSADIGMTSRDPSSDEAVGLIETKPIAIDGIVLIVNNKNTIENIALDKVRGMYLEKYTIWNEVF